MKQQTKFPRAKPYKRSVTDIKALVRHRDGYRCQKCGLTAKENYRRYKKSLDVHRLTPGSRYTIKGCITICRVCHGLEPRTPNGLGNGPNYVRLQPEIYQAMKKLAEENGRTLMAEVRLAVIAHLQKKGHWPPKEQQ